VDVVTVGKESVGQVTADKARAAGDEITHRQEEPETKK
jgi:hypothetical protein